MKLSKWVCQEQSQRRCEKKVEPSEEVELAQVAEERVDYQTKGDYDEP